MKKRFNIIISIQEIIILLLIFLLVLTIVSIRIWDFKTISFPFSFIPEIKSNEAVSVVYGVTGGVLSLMGLLSIFVSINSQHRIEKSRELYWNIIDLPFEQIDKTKLALQMAKNLRNFITVRNGKDPFVLIVTKVSQWTIIFVCLVWSVYVSMLFNMDFASFFLLIINMLGVFILLAFYGILRNIRKIDFIGEVPNSYQFLDYKEGQEIDVASLYFVPHNILFNIKDNELILSLRLPVNNITLMLVQPQFVCGDNIRLLNLGNKKSIQMNYSIEEFQELVDEKHKLVLAKYPIPQDLYSFNCRFKTIIHISGGGESSSTKMIAFEAEYLVHFATESETELIDMKII